MEYPSSITIKGQRYKVEYVETLREVGANFEGEDWIGFCDHANKTIRVFADRVPFDIVETFLHEVTHGIFNRNKALKLALKDGAEEIFVDAFSTDLLAFLLENGYIQLPEGLPPITKRIVDEVR